MQKPELAFYSYLGERHSNNCQLSSPPKYGLKEIFLSKWNLSDPIDIFFKGQVVFYFFISIEEHLFFIKFPLMALWSS
jgi:hypothetical protein